MSCTSNQTGGIHYNTASIYSYAAFVFGLMHRWTYSLRTLPDIVPSLEPLARACHSRFTCASYHRACYYTGRTGSFRTPSLLRRAWATQLDRQQPVFFDVWVCHPNADSYQELSPKEIFQLHENEKKRQYSRQVLEVEQGTFTPLVFTSTGGMADECKRFHSRLAELLALKKGAR